MKVPAAPQGGISAMIPADKSAMVQADKSAALRQAAGYSAADELTTRKGIVRLWSISPLWSG
jgi:hypothetical protein